MIYKVFAVVFIRKGIFQIVMIKLLVNKASYIESINEVQAREKLVRSSVLKTFALS